jgi:arylsulfatase A-like enzyme
MNKLLISISAGIAVAHSAVFAAESVAEPRPLVQKPNIIVILADDLGYGDVQCLNPKRGKIPTPNIDKLAAAGMTFIDGHSTSAVCTPSRYSLLTGRYNWRTRLQKEVLAHDSPPLIAPGRLTLPALLQAQGYRTGAVGKWHLGMQWARKNGKPDFSAAFTGGPTECGFDWYYGVPIPGHPPHGFIENNRLQGTASEIATKNMVVWGGMVGPMVPGFTFESMLPVQTDKACDFIRSNAAANRPFFLYYAMNSPHNPLTPNQEWLGKSGLGQYADFVMETDAMVGRILAAIEASGQAKQTLVVFTSDNGCAPYAGTAIRPDGKNTFKNGNVHQLEARGHFPSAQFRGYKSDTWDGGHRVPFIVRWPDVVRPGTTCAQLACQMDLPATCAEIIGAKIPDNAGEDSVSLLPLLNGGDQPVRDTLVHHSFNGNFAIREGQWKLGLCSGSGGWSPGPKAPLVQLYDMSKDEGEQTNLQAEHPEIVKRLTEKLKKLVADGRSTPGTPQKNDVPVDIFKKGK